MSSLNLFNPIACLASARECPVTTAHPGRKVRPAGPWTRHATNLLQNAVKQKIDFASPKKNSDNPTTKRKNELLEQKKEIIAKQGDGKNSRTAKQDEIKRLGDQIKSREKERDGLKELIQYKNNSKEVVYIRSPEVADNLLADLKAKIDSGKLSLLEDRTTVEQINTINRVTKHFKKVDEKQKEIDDLKAKRDEIKDTMNSPESKELNEKFDKVQAELNAINAEQAEAKKNLSSLFEEKDKLNALQQEKWVAIKKIKDEYYQQRNAFRDFEREQKQKAWERSRAERERRDKERKLERAQKMLAEASDPAYLDEIRRANSLLQYFDPSFVVEKAPLQASTNLQAQAERKVDDSELKGVKILSKKDRDEDLFPAQKKGKKGKKHNAASKSIFNCPPSVVEDCSAMGIDPPMSAEEVPGVIEKVKAKLEHWKADQAAQTQKVGYSQIHRNEVGKCATLLTFFL